MFILMAGVLSGCGTGLERAGLDAGLSQPEPLLSSGDSGKQGGDQNETKSADRLTQLAADIEARGEKGTALTLYEQAAKTEDTAAAHIRFGDACLRAGLTAKAAQAYRAAIAKEPANGRALMGLGVTLAKQGEFERALAFLQKAAPLVDTAEAYDRLGVALTLAGQPQEAVASLEEARKRAPRDLDIAANLALAAALAGQDDRAVAIMRETVASPSADSRHWRNLVLVLGLAGRTEEARAAAPRDAQPKEIQTLLARAKAIRDQSDPKARARALGLQRVSSRGRAGTR